MLRSLVFVCAVLTVPAFAFFCTYPELQSASSAYVASRARGDVSYLTSTTYTENFVSGNITSSTIAQPLKVDFSRSIHDTTQCATFTEMVITDPKHPYVIGTQMRLDHLGRIIKVDTIVTDADDWFFNATSTLYYSSRENWGPIPFYQQDTRETIQHAGDAYLDLFNNASVAVPWGTPCDRLEGGWYMGAGLKNDTCDLGVPTGVPMVDRQYVIDEALGVVDIFLRFQSDTGVPDSHEFRIEKGKIRMVHTMSVTAGWEPS